MSVGLGAQVGVGRVRVATGGDVLAIDRLLHRCGVRGRGVEVVGDVAGDRVGVATLGVGAVGGAVRAAAAPGAGLVVLRRQLDPVLRSGDLQLARMLCTTVLVVECDRDVIGVVVAAPARSLLEHISPRVDERARRAVVSRGVSTVVEVCAVAVDERWRRRGVGTYLVDEVVSLYRAAGYRQGFGQVPDRPEWVGFAVATGLSPTGVGAGVDLTAVLGVPAVIRPTAGHRLLHLHNP